MIRNVTLYTVSSKRVTAVDGPHIYTHSRLLGDIKVVWGAEAPDTYLVTEERLPIHCLRNGIEEAFVALDPKLKQLLEIPLSAEVTSLREDSARMSEHNRKLHLEVGRQERSKLRFNSLSKIKKLWYILKGGEV